MDIAILILLIILLVFQVILLIRGNRSGTDSITKSQLQESESRITGSIHALSRDQANAGADLRVAFHNSARTTETAIAQHFTDMVQKNAQMQQASATQMAEHIGILQRTMETRMDSFQAGISDNLRQIQGLTERKLSDIQKNVNDKLDASLNKRLDESFEKVTNQLAQLYKSLGELGEMSDGITNLNRTLSNVKTRGTWGEIQLGSILEETMAANQYERNVKLRKNSNDMVEFAIKIPTKEDDNSFVYLPIDSKFPLDTYGNLVDASESGDRVSYETCQKALETRIKNEARSIRDKYIVPPTTLDFAILFLPTESLYAEVLRINGLAEYCQNNLRVILASPSTITALLNSLRIGFANVALNKKTAEVRKILEAVKSQYGKLDELIDATKKKLEEAVNSTDKLKNRTRLINNKMSKIAEIDLAESNTLLMIEEPSE